MHRPSWPSDRTLKRINRALLGAIILLNGYVILAPFLPQIDFWIDTKITKPVTADVSTVDRSTNRLIIQKLQLEEPIHEGANESALEKGLWRRPQTSTPDKGSNTVVVGHRFLYGDKSPFYHLNKLAVGDTLHAVYGGKIYEYQIVAEKTTPPTDQSVEAPSNDDILTIYTCTPLWTAENRLVYTAKLERVIE